jgi:hypothetical protein
MWHSTCQPSPTSIAQQPQVQGPPILVVWAHPMSCRCEAQWHVPTCTAYSSTAALILLTLLHHIAAVLTLAIRSGLPLATALGALLNSRTGATQYRVFRAELNRWLVYEASESVHLLLEAVSPSSQAAGVEGGVMTGSNDPEAGLQQEQAQGTEALPPLDVDAQLSLKQSNAEEVLMGVMETIRRNKGPLPTGVNASSRQPASTSTSTGPTVTQGTKAVQGQGQGPASTSGPSLPSLPDLHTSVFMGAVARNLGLLLSLAAPTSRLPEKRLFLRLLAQLVELDAEALLRTCPQDHPGQQGQGQVPELVVSYASLITGLKARTGPVATCRAEGLELLPRLMLPLRGHAAALGALCQAVQTVADALATQGVTR